MNLIVLVSANAVARMEMLQAISGLGPDFDVMVGSSVATIENYVNRAMPAATIALLCVDDRQTMCDLEALRFALDSFRLLFVLDTSDKVLVELAHRFYPRVVMDAATSHAEVPVILDCLTKAV